MRLVAISVHDDVQTDGIRSEQIKICVYKGLFYLPLNEKRAEAGWVKKKTYFELTLTDGSDAIFLRTYQRSYNSETLTGPSQVPLPVHLSCQLKFLFFLSSTQESYVSLY